MIHRAFIVTVCTVLAVEVSGYPLDGWKETHIHRLEAYQRAQQALLERGSLSPGALLSTAAVEPRLLDRPAFELPTSDPELASRLEALIQHDGGRTAVALLDLTDPDAPRYAEHNGLMIQNPGSVGKMAVALGWFQALADFHPADVAARARILRDTELVAGPIIERDHHEVPFWRPGEDRVRKRPLELGDRGNLWTWLDWMLSASSNAAASTLMQELLVLQHFGPAYPPPPERAQAFLDETPKARLGALLREALRGPLERNGFDPDRFRQGSLFTAEGKRRIPGESSVATARELVRWLLHIEQGRFVDRWSSAEMKRLLYLTDRRIRYAAHPSLAESAVYFKSGSLYSCQPEPGFLCKKYHGNVRNYMNSVAIVETERAGAEPLHYLVAVLSNVLRKNSAVEHQTLAMQIHRLVESLHPTAEPSATPARAVPLETAPTEPSPGSEG